VDLETKTIIFYVIASVLDPITTLLSQTVSNAVELSPIGRIFLNYSWFVSGSLMFSYSMLVLLMFKFIGKELEHVYIYSIIGLTLSKIIASANNYLIYLEVFNHVLIPLAYINMVGFMVLGTGLELKPYFFSRLR